MNVHVARGFGEIAAYIRVFVSLAIIKTLLAVLEINVWRATLWEVAVTAGIVWAAIFLTKRFRAQ